MDLAWALAITITVVTTISSLHSLSEGLKQVGCSFKLGYSGIEVIPPLNDIKDVNKPIKENKRPFRKVVYRPSTIPSMIGLPMWTEGIIHNQLVSFGVYRIGLKDEYLAVVDVLGGRHRFKIGNGMRISYVDVMTLKIQTSHREVILAKGSPFITFFGSKPDVESDSYSSLNESDKRVCAEIRWYPISDERCNVSILPNSPVITNILQLNSQVTIKKVKVDGTGNLQWLTDGPDSLLLFVHSSISKIGIPTGIKLKTTMGTFRMVRGNIWEYKSGKESLSADLPEPPKLEDVLYDKNGRRYIIESDPPHSVELLTSLMVHCNQKGDIQMSKLLARSLYGFDSDGKKNSLFVPFYSIDFYYQSLYKVRVLHLPDLIKRVMQNFGNIKS